MIFENVFFERPDKEKQFLYQLIMEEPDPEAAMKNLEFRVHWKLFQKSLG